MTPRQSIFARALLAMAGRIMDWLAPQARYEGASWSPSRSTVAGAFQSQRYDAPFGTRTELARKARYFERNNAIVNRMADLWEQYTVGDGLVVQPASSDAEWNRKAAEWWAMWSELPDIGSRQPLGTLLGMMARGWFIDGEQFCLFTKGQTGFPRLQIIESHLVRTPDRLVPDDAIIDGVRVELTTLRPVSYFVNSDRGDKTDFAEVPTSAVAHLFEPARPGQLRGLTLLHPVLNDLHDLDDLQILEMRAAKDAARVSKVIKPKIEEMNPAAYRAAQVTGTANLVGGGTAAMQRTEYYHTVLGEESVILQPGDEYDQHISQRPSVVTQDYWRTIQEKVCIGCGMPLVLVLPDSMQGTVYRGAMDSAAAFFRLRSAVMQSLVKRIYGYAMGWARYAEPTLQDAPADWRRIRISPPRAVNVDIGYSADAMVKGLAAMTTNWGNIYSAQGQDWRDQIDAYSEQLEYLKAKGLNPSLGTAPAPAPMPEPATPEQPEEESIDGDTATATA